MANDIVERARGLLAEAETLAAQAGELAREAEALATEALAGGAATAAAHGGDHGIDFILQGLTVLVLACFVGYHVVWRVTPALHSPLMAVTNAVSSVIIVGALIAAGPITFDFSSAMGLIGVVLASVNIFGGFLVTQRMLAMYKKKQK